MTAIRISCWLAVIGLGAACLTWALQYGAAPGAAAPAMAGGTPRHQTGSTTLNDPQRAGRKLRELTVGLDGFRMPCIDCHALLGSPPKDPVSQGGRPHEHVVLDHGENDRCFNCHHPRSDRYGFFVSNDGSAIPIESVERLCAKCHGPHYRDWKHGSHGLWTGYWNADPADPERRKTAPCISCHDPHQPRFKPIPTLPGPRSLRGEALPDHPCRERH